MKIDLGYVCMFQKLEKLQPPQGVAHQTKGWAHS